MTSTPEVSPAKVGPIAQLLTLDQLVADPQQPRKAFDDGALADLAASIKAEGMLAPIIVKPNGKGFHVVDGERRLRAAKLAGLKEVPVIVRADLKDQDVTAHQLVANIQREDLSLPEQCDAVARLVKSLNGPDGKGGQAKAATKLGKSEAWVSKRAALVAAPAPVRELLNKGHVVDAEVAGGLVELLQVSDPKKDWRAKQLFEQAKKPDTYGGPLTRDDVRDAIRSAKDEIKSREEAAKKAAKTRKAIASGKQKPDPHQERARREREQKDERNRKWAILNPLLKKFGEAVQGVVGGRIDLPRHYDYYPDAPPASVATAQFSLHVSGNAEQLQRFVSKTGLTVKLQADQFPDVSPEQAKKIEAVIGKPLTWRDNVALTGEKLAKLAEKSGKKIEIPVADLSKPKAAEKPADKSPKKKH